MTKVLIVDDHIDYREELEFALSRRGFEVATAASGRTAIDIGAWFRPDVLVADWVLVDQIHGIQVAETLRLLTPDLPLVLMSGFASPDLEFEARQVEVFRLIEKPFSLDRMIRAVGAAAASDHKTLRSKPVGVIEIDSRGQILFASPRAYGFFAETGGSGTCRHLRDFLDHIDIAKLDAAEEEWIDVEPHRKPRSSADPSLHWQVRSRSLPQTGTRLLVLHKGCLRLVDHRRDYYSSNFLVRLLLDIPEHHKPRWPLEGRALVIDDSEMFRRLAAAEIERASGFCHSVNSYSASLEVLRGDPAIEVIIVDHRVLTNTAGEMVESFKALSPNVLIAGQSLENDRHAFASHGVDHFLPKPWQIEELITLLAGSRGLADRRSCDPQSTPARSPATR